MTQDQPRRRGVTRGYVVGLVAATAIVAAAIVVAAWGLLGLVVGREPVATAGVSPVAAELIVLVALAALVAGLWQQALVLLRGRAAPPWAHIIVAAGAAYFIWCFGGLLVGMSLEDTWISPYALVLTATWALCALLFWAVLARRVFTERPVPRWPWERRNEGPDWIRYGSDGSGGSDGSDGSGGSDDSDAPDVQDDPDAPRHPGGGS